MSGKVKPKQQDTIKVTEEWKRDVGWRDFIHGPGTEYALPKCIFNEMEFKTALELGLLDYALSYPAYSKWLEKYGKTVSKSVKKVKKTAHSGPRR